MAMILAAMAVTGPLLLGVLFAWLASLETRATDPEGTAVTGYFYLWLLASPVVAVAFLTWAGVIWDASSDADIEARQIQLVVFCGVSLLAGGFTAFAAVKNVDSALWFIAMGSTALVLVGGSAAAFDALITKREADDEPTDGQRRPRSARSRRHGEDG